MRTALQVLGMGLLVLGGQGLVRVVLLNDDGLLGVLPGGFGAALVGHVALVVLGLLLLVGTRDTA